MQDDAAVVAVDPDQSDNASVETQSDQLPYTPTKPSGSDGLNPGLGSSLPDQDGSGAAALRKDLDSMLERLEELTRIVTQRIVSPEDKDPSADGRIWAGQRAQGESGILEARGYRGVGHAIQHW